MRSLLSLVLALVVASCAYAAPYEKTWTKRSGIDIHIEWPGSEGKSSSSRWPVSNSLSNLRWPFSGDYGSYAERSPPPTATVQKRSYLDAEEKAETTGSCDLQSAVNYMDLSAG